MFLLASRIVKILWRLKPSPCSATTTWKRAATMAWRREGPQSMVVTNASTVQLLQHPREACLAREEAALMDPVWRRKVAVLLAIAVTLAD